MKYIFKIYLIIVFLFQTELKGDSFKYNSYNNHGVIGLINMPTARFYDEQSHGLTIYDGTPDQKITISSSPYDWLEATPFIQIFKVCHTQVMNTKIIKIRVLT